MISVGGVECTLTPPGCWGDGPARGHVTACRSNADARSSAFHGRARRARLVRRPSVGVCRSGAGGRDGRPGLARDERGDACLRIVGVDGIHAVDYQGQIERHLNRLVGVDTVDDNIGGAGGTSHGPTKVAAYPCV